VPGELVKTIPVTVIDDATIETAETVLVTLSNVTGASMGSLNVHTLTINDDDLPVVSIVANDPNAAEAGLDPGQFTVSRTGPTTSPLTVTLKGTGTATGADGDRNDIVPGYSQRPIQCHVGCHAFQQ
jgi:hypothetical protein